MPFKVDPAKIQTAEAEAAEDAANEAARVMREAEAAAWEAQMQGKPIPADVRTRWLEAKQRTRARGRRDNGSALVPPEAP